MSCKHEGEKPVQITTRDKVMRAWENSMELTRDFELYSKQINDDDEIATIILRNRQSGSD